MTRIRRLFSMVVLAAAPLGLPHHTAMAAGYAICQTTAPGQATCTCYTNQYPKGQACTQAQADALNGSGSTGGGGSTGGPGNPPHR